MCPYMHIIIISIHIINTHAYIHPYMYIHPCMHTHIAVHVYITFCLLMEGGMVMVHRILRVMPQPIINIPKICFVTNYKKLLLLSPIGNKDRVTPQKTHKQQNTNKIQNTRDKTKQNKNKGINQQH